MSSLEFKPTRMELIALRRRLNLAQKGLKLLQEKQDALIMEFFAAIQKYKKLRESLLPVFKEAYFALANAEIEMGALKLERIAEGVPETVNVEIKFKNVMGVLVPVIEAKIENIRRPYSLTDTSIYLETVSEKFSQLLPAIIKLAEVSATIIKLSEEIKRIHRRVNVLDKIIIPTLNNAISYIKFYLEEREREDLFRVKRIKKKLERRSQPL